MNIKYIFRYLQRTGKSRCRAQTRGNEGNRRWTDDRVCCEQSARTKHKTTNAQHCQRRTVHKQQLQGAEPKATATEKGGSLHKPISHARNNNCTSMHATAKERQGNEQTTSNKTLQLNVHEPKSKAHAKCTTLCALYVCACVCFAWATTQYAYIYMQYVYIFHSLGFRV